MQLELTRELKASRLRWDAEEWLPLAGVKWRKALRSVWKLEEAEKMRLQTSEVTRMLRASCRLKEVAS